MSIVAFFSIGLPSMVPRHALHFGLVGSDEWRLLNNPANKCPIRSSRRGYPVDLIGLSQGGWMALTALAEQ